MNYKKAKEELRKWAVKSTGCDIQNGWPCGTCFINLLEELGLNSENAQYKEHNKPVNRANEVWRAILQIREEKLCDNTDCQSKNPTDIRKVILKKEFNHDVCYWCKDCRKRDKEMIAK